MNEVIKKIREFRDDRDWKQFHTPENLAKSIVIEAGELLENFQWDGKTAKVDHVKEELADVLIYCLLLCDTYGFDLKTIVLEKIEANNKKYPVSKAKGNAKKYNEF